MTSQAWRRIGVPGAVALLVLVVVLGVVRLAGQSGDSTGAGPGAGSGAGSSGDAGSSPSGGAGGVGGEPAPDPAGPTSRFTAVTRGGDGRSLEVRFWGGVEDCYRYTVGAVETGSMVRLRLVEKSTFGGACIELAQQYDRTVPLDGALGTRTVVDAATGDVLLAPSP